MINKKRILLSPFWLSIFLHLLLLIFFSLAVVLTPDQKAKKPVEPLPTYLYTQKVPPRTMRQIASRQQKKSTAAQQKIKIPPSARTAELNMSNTNDEMPHESILSKSLKMLDENQLKEVTASFQNTDPMYLIGEESAHSDPFLMLLGKALSANFAYPKAAGALGIRGRVVISLMINPEGYFSEVRIMQSSNNHDLDAAALYAVNQAPIIEEMKRFISKPKHFVVGFIFK